MMSFSTQEILANAGRLFTLLSEKVAEDSDGGVSITLSEWLDVAKEIGLQIVQDVTD
jgi:hypothetical protein